MLAGCAELLFAAPAADGSAFFEAKIRPLFIEHCQKCHGELKQEGGLRLDTKAGWLWRHARRPLDAESIRDAMLAVSGRFDRIVPGPHPFPEVQKWGYTIHNPFLALFDAADPNQSVAQRLPTTTPTQTLYLMNSPFVQQQAETFARRLLAESGDDSKRVRLAFEMAHGRAPANTEVNDVVAFLGAYRQKLASLEKPPADNAELAWAGFARVLLTSNAFLYGD